MAKPVALDVDQVGRPPQKSETTSALDRKAKFNDQPDSGQSSSEKENKNTSDKPQITRTGSLLGKELKRQYSMSDVDKNRDLYERGADIRSPPGHRERLASTGHDRNNERPSNRERNSERDYSSDRRSGRHHDKERISRPGGGHEEGAGREFDRNREHDRFSDHSSLGRRDDHNRDSNSPAEHGSHRRRGGAGGVEEWTSDHSMSSRDMISRDPAFSRDGFSRDQTTMPATRSDPVSRDREPITRDDRLRSSRERRNREPSNERFREDMPVDRRRDEDRLR